MTGYQAYVCYLAMFRHFKTDGYDFIKYRGKVKVKRSTYDSRKDKYQFEKLARKYKYEELVGLLVSHFSLKDGGLWIGDILTDDFASGHLSWQKRMQSISFVFEQDLLKLKELDVPFDKLFKCIDGHPHIIKMLLGQHIAIESVIILDKAIHFIKNIQEPLQDDFVFEILNKRIYKYSKFIQIQDIQKYKDIIVKVFK